MNNTIKILGKSILGVAFMLCLLNMPYDYYQVVRFIGMAGFAWFAYLDSNRIDKSLMMLWIASLLLINPFMKIALSRTIWNVFDVIWTAILLITIWTDIKAIRKNKRQYPLTNFHAKKEQV